MLKNLFFNMSILGANFLVPIVIIPVISNYYTDQNLTDYLYSQVLLAIMLVVVDWGFSTTGIKELDNSEDKIQKLVDISFFKCAIFILSFAAILGWHAVFDTTTSITILAILLLSGLSFCISPIFYFQYTEKVKVFSVLNVSFKIAFLLIASLMAASGYDFYWIVILFTITQIAPNLFLFSRLIGKANTLSWQRSFSLGKAYFSYMSASLMSTVYRVFPVVIMAQLYKGEKLFMVYLVVDRIVRGGNSLIQPLTNTLLPITLKQGGKNLHIYIYGFFGVMLSALYLLFGPSIYALLTSEQESNEYAQAIFNTIFLLPFVISISSYFGNQVLLAKNKVDYIAKVIRTVSIFFAIYSVYFLINERSVYEMIIAMIIAELSVLAGFLYGTKKIKRI